MAEETRDANEILASWNPPPKDSGYDLTVGLAVPEGDTRATAALGNDPSKGGDVASEYDEMSKDDLQDALRERDLPVSGSKQELIARLQEDDNSEDDEEDA